MIQYTCIFRSNRIQVLERDGFACQICHIMNDLQVHHVIPLRLNGPDDMSNLITLCSSCHVIEESKLRPPIESSPKKMSGELMKLLCPKCNKIYYVASVRPCECVK